MKNLIKPLITGMGLMFLSTTTVLGFPGHIKNPECGIASHYSSGTYTANGERYNHLGISAAHKYLPFGTRVIVRHMHTHRSIMVRINDRGPFIPGRIIDLSTGAKNALGMGGLAPVCIDIVSYGLKDANINHHSIQGNKVHYNKQSVSLEYPILLKHHQKITYHKSHRHHRHHRHHYE